MKHEWMNSWKTRVPSFLTGIPTTPRNIALGAGGICLATVVVALGASAVEDAKKDDAPFNRAAENWQTKMSDIFRETWHGLAGGPAAVASASVDLREQEQAYVVRLNLPKRDLSQVKVKLESGVLHVVAPGAGTTGSYDQALGLPDADPGAELKVDRRPADDLITITVPKKPKSTTAAGTSLSVEQPPVQLPDWDRDILGRMDRMTREMDRVFNEAFGEFRSEPAHSGYFDLPDFGSSVAVKDDGTKYVVSAYLPSRDMQKVDVSVDGTALKIEAQAEEATSPPATTGGEGRKRYSHYLQTLTLPGPVKVEKMNIERKEGMLTITLPKA
jgi:HSP20 family molecular chaperone IbpA